MGYLGEPEHDPHSEQVQQWMRQHYVHLALGELDEPCRKIIVGSLSVVDSLHSVSDKVASSRNGHDQRLANCFGRLEAILARMDSDLAR